MSPPAWKIHRLNAQAPLDCSSPCCVKAAESQELPQVSDAHIESELVHDLVEQLILRGCLDSGLLQEKCVHSANIRKSTLVASVGHFARVDDS
ncbi:hypothetical protein C9412_09680 [Stenotrophomonas sp. Nf1]|nr:hypothetical protein C9412_09680 [Stenotrophomonas sp. Nf1]PTA81437.1 hypothetical protein C9416_07230 [Stenotrophomonas sp. Nf4]